MDAQVRPRGGLADRSRRGPPHAGRPRPHQRAAASGGQATGPVGRAPAPRPRRAGLRPGQAGAHERDPGHVDLRAPGLRLPGARLGQQRDPRPRRQRRAEGALAGAVAVRGAPFGVLDDRAGHAWLRSDAAGDPRRARRGRLRARRAQVVHLERVDRRLSHRHGRHRPGCAATSARVDVRRAGRRGGRDDRPRRPDDGASAAALRRPRRALRDPLRGRPARRRRAVGGGGGGLPDRAEAPRPGSHPSLHALARHGSPRVRRDVRARALPARQARPPARHADRARRGSPTPPRRCRPHV